MSSSLFGLAERRLPLAGWLLGASIPAALASALFGLSPLPGGLLQLTAAVLLFTQVARRIRILSLLLALLGLAALCAAHFAYAVPLDTALRVRLLGANQPMIAMLAAVGMLRFIPVPAGGEAVRGRWAVWQTLFGVHWLGSVTNLSAVVLFGDRIADGEGRLDRQQTLVLARGFSMAALWSPFFIAIAVAFSQAPNATLFGVFLRGLPISELLLALFAWRLSRSVGPDGFVGYPFTPASLKGPLLLTAAVLGTHLLVPHRPVVALVTAAAPLYALYACRREQPGRRLAVYLRDDLPRMGPEVLLFIAAGVLGTGFTALVRGSGLVLPLPASGALALALGLGIILLLAAAGIHPIVGITAVGAFLARLGLPPDLLALSYTMGWGLGVLIGPTSGTNLLLAGRYRFPLGRVWAWQGGFVAGAYLLCCGWLWLLAGWH